MHKPKSKFDFMINLTLKLSEEAKLGGPKPNESEAFKILQEEGFLEDILMRVGEDYLIKEDLITNKGSLKLKVFDLIRHIKKKNEEYK